MEQGTKTGPGPKPAWLKRRLPGGKSYRETTEILSRLNLHTVCQEAHCPNIGDCFSRRIATVMILGDKCTRGCRFCGVVGEKPLPPDPEEPLRVAEAVAELGLHHVVITMVTRDDLADGGAAHIARTLEALHQACPRTTVELLSSDFAGAWDGLREIVRSGLDIWGHNMETVPRLYAEVRPEANYSRSLELFERVRALAPDLPLKSALMLGLGETEEEIEAVLRDLRSVDVDRLTLGQYLAPSSEHYPVREYITPEAFKQWKERALEMGFKVVESHPFARSSYYGPEQFDRLQNELQG